MTSVKATDEELLAKRDDDIVRRAQLWATGATVHDTNELIGLYRDAIYKLDRHPDPKWKTPPFRRYALELMVCYANRLAAFMSHGDSKKARRDFLPPRYPVE